MGFGRGPGRRSFRPRRVDLIPVMSEPLVVLAIGALLGMALGMLGGGGGILAIPLLVAIGEPVLVASTMSLLIVGTGSMAALVPHQRAGRVDWRVGLTFGAFGAVGAVVGARAAQGASATVLLAGLGVLLAVGAATMLRAARRDWQEAPVTEGVEPALVGAGRGPSSASEPHSDVEVATAVPSWPRMVGLGGAVGLVTGFFGVGAGFVVVPALVAAIKLPVKRATATALVVIVINSSVALAVRHASLGPADLTAALAASTAVFAVVGAKVSRRVPSWVLSAAFGTLMVVVAVYTLAKAVTAT